MSCGKCGCGKGMRLCPVSFGLALGLTCFLMVLAVVALAPHFAMAAQWMEMMHITAPTMKAGLIHACYAFVRGLVFGLVLALIYDLIIKICKCCRKKGDGESCKCGVSVKKVEIK